MIQIGRGWVLVPQESDKGIRVPNGVVRTKIFQLFLNGYYIHLGEYKIALQKDGSVKIIPCCSVCASEEKYTGVVKPPCEPCPECGNAILR